MLSALVDNDVVEKMTKWRCLELVAKALSVPLDSVWVLGALKYVVGSRLSRSHGDEVIDQLMEFLKVARELEPTEEEVALAALIEETSIKAGVDVDIGESQIFAVAITREITWIATGDKRAVCGCASIEPHLPQIKKLRRKFVSIEQMLASLIEHVGHLELRERVCREHKSDKTASICFVCRGEAPEKDSIIKALESYQRDLANNSNNFASDCLMLRA